MKSLASQALADAAVAHQFQHRWGNGEPYVNHAWRVYLSVRKANPRVAIQAAAALHDVLEDQPLYDFQGAGVGENGLHRKYGREVTSIVKALTHRNDRRLTDGEYETYIERVKRNPDAVVVKVADLLDNLHGLPYDHENYPRYRRALESLDSDGAIQRAMGLRGRAIRTRYADRETLQKHAAAHRDVTATQPGRV